LEIDTGLETLVTVPRAIGLALGALLVLTTAYFEFLVTPLALEIHNLRTTIPQERQRLATLMTIGQEQERLSRLLSQASLSGPASDSPSLLSVTEEVVRKLDLSERAMQMRSIPVTEKTGPAKEERLEIRFVTLGFRQLLEFIDAVEALPSHIRFDSVEINKTHTSASMRVVISSLLFGSGASQ